MGKGVGFRVGADDGDSVGSAVGSGVGCTVGEADGTLVGGTTESGVNAGAAGTEGLKRFGGLAGARLGGLSAGLPSCSINTGCLVGRTDGERAGEPIGDVVGEEVGPADGESVGFAVGDLDGLLVGFAVGFSDGFVVGAAVGFIPASISHSSVGVCPRSEKIRHLPYGGAGVSPHAALTFSSFSRHWQISLSRNGQDGSSG